MRTKLTTLALSLLVFSCYFGKDYLSQWKQNHPKTIGQTAPPDMIYIEGHGEMKPFYIGVQEETNRNYMIYLKWLKRVFVSYPEVVEEAYPKLQAKSRHFFNDPYERDYFKHAAFMHYPVVGLTWEQTQNYLTWKTDRLNEYILLENGILDVSQQQEEDSFNTEAYLFGQYEGTARKNLILRDANRPLFFKIYNNKNKIDTMPFYWAEYYGATVGEERIIDPNDGLLFPNFRLPTESEWEQAKEFSASLHPEYQTWTIGETVNKRFPYKKYYTKYWEENDKYSYIIETLENGVGFDDNGFVCGEAAAGYGRHEDMDWENDYCMPIPYESSKRKIVNQFKMSKYELTNQNVYKGYGVTNMDRGVREWLYDKWEEEWDSTSTNTLEILAKNGVCFDCYLVGEDGDFVEKDSLGRIQNAKWIDYTDNGEMVLMGSPEYGQEKTLAIAKRVVKGGHWESHTINHRMAVPQDSAALDIGFRVVLPAINTPPTKRIKW